MPLIRAVRKTLRKLFPTAYELGRTERISMRDPLLEALIRALRETENALQQSVEPFGRRIESEVASWTRTLHRIEPSTRLWLTCLGVALTVLLFAVAIPAIGDVGSGYFLRAAVLLAGISLGMLLDPQRRAP